MPHVGTGAVWGRSRRPGALSDDCWDSHKQYELALASPWFIADHYLPTDNGRNIDE